MHYSFPARLPFLFLFLVLGTLSILSGGMTEISTSPPSTDTKLPLTTPIPPGVTTASTVNENDASEAVTSLTPVLECVSEADHLFKFVFDAHRNSTGHWIAHMDVQPGAGPLMGEEHPFEVQLQHRTRTCAACEDQPPPYARISLSEPPPLNVPKVGGYRFFPGFGFYKRHLEEKNWHEARATCQEEGADLVVINSEMEAKLLLELSAPLLFLKPGATWNAEAYVGIYDFHHEGHFTTVKGTHLEDIGYVQWSPGEPNNHREEDCVTIVRNGMYNDVGCSKAFEFICKIEE